MNEPRGTPLEEFTNTYQLPPDHQQRLGVPVCKLDHPPPPVMPRPVVEIREKAKAQIEQGCPVYLLSRFR